MREGYYINRSGMLVLVTTANQLYSVRVDVDGKPAWLVDKLVTLEDLEREFVPLWLQMNDKVSYIGKVWRMRCINNQHEVELTKDGSDKRYKLGMKEAKQNLLLL